MSDYQRSLAFLFQRTTGAIRPGLERVRALLAELGNPHEGLTVLHVAGTNGKGSTVATLDALLRAQGRRVGRYTSPHLVDFRERIVVDGAPVPAEFVVEWLARWTPAIERTGATFFEATTAMALHWFREREVDVAVLETGLGGRHDATNVVRPLGAAVTNISIDHVDYLGHTLPQIAAEKGGIFKPGVPAVIGDPRPQERALLEAEARAAGASAVAHAALDWPATEVRLADGGTRFRLAHGDEAAELWTPLAGRHQALNTATALALLHAVGGAWAVSLADAARWLPGVRLPGRFQRVGDWLFDVAHNPDGAAVLAQALRDTTPARPLVAVVSVLTDKDWARMLATLVPVVDAVVVTDAPTAPETRRWDAVAAAAHARALGAEVVLERDFDQALAEARARAATVVVTGSFHTVGDAMARLQLAPLAE